MDTYIKMCDCYEIQGLRRGLEGDFIYCRDSKKTITIYPGSFSINSIWLPRQSQLQEIICQLAKPQGLLCMNYLIPAIYNFQKESNSKGELYFSMEQIWLAFVMKKKFNKVWNGDNWIKEDNNGK